MDAVPVNPLHRERSVMIAKQHPGISWGIAILVGGRLPRVRQTLVQLCKFFLAWVSNTSRNENLWFNV